MTLEFDSFWDKIVTKANELEVENTKLPRKVVKPLRFRDSAKENVPPNEKDYFENIYNEAFQNVTKAWVRTLNLWVQIFFTMETRGGDNGVLNCCNS